MSSCHWNYNQCYYISGFFQGRVFRQLKAIKEQALDQVQTLSYLGAQGAHLANMVPGPLGAG